MGRRCLAVLTALCLLAGLVPAWAAGTSVTVAMRLGSPWCIVGEEFHLIDEGSRQVVPVAEQGVTLVPVRRIMEAFGGRADYVPATQGVVCTLRGRQVELTLDSDVALVDGREVKLDVPARAEHQRTFVPLRFVAENLGLSVGYEAGSQVVVLRDGALKKDGLAELQIVQDLVRRTGKTADPVALKTGSWDLASGKVTANVVTVDMEDLRVSAKVALPGGKLDATSPFQATCEASGAAVVLNGNFFSAYDAVKDPIGHVMAEGTFLYGDSGISSLGITADNQMRFGRPAVFVRVKSGDREWSAYGVNVLEQTKDGSVLYTPARGASVPVGCAGWAMTVERDTVKSYGAVKKGDSLSIPAGGYVLFMGEEFASTHYFRAPETGRKVTLEPYLMKTDSEGFTLDGVVSMVSGAPRLVKNGRADTSKDTGFTDSKFTTQATPRSAVGATGDGRLLLVTTPSATIGQLRELMLELGCVDAVNLDGGASVGLWCRGQMVSRPGRELAATIQIFVDG